MKSNRLLYDILPVLLVLAMVAAGLLLGGCSGEDEALGPASLDPVSPQVVNEFVNSLPDWQLTVRRRRAAGRPRR